MKKSHVSGVLYCLDLWPDSLIAGGVKRGSVLFRVFHKISARIYRQMDRILVTSRMFQPYMHEQFDIAAERIPLPEPDGAQ